MNTDLGLKTLGENLKHLKYLQNLKLDFTDKFYSYFYLKVNDFEKPGENFRSGIRGSGSRLKDIE